MKTLKKTTAIFALCFMMLESVYAQTDPCEHDPNDNVLTNIQDSQNTTAFINALAAQGVTATYNATTFTYTIANQTFSIAGYFNLVHSIIFDGCHILMDPGAIINSSTNFNSGHVFHLKHNTIIEAFCYKMWAGIFNAHHGITIIEDSYIYDAQYAIYVGQKTELQIYRSFFDRNYVSIYLAPSGTNVFLSGSIIEDTDFSGAGTLKLPFTGQTPVPGSKPLAGMLLNDVYFVSGIAIPFSRKVNTLTIFHDLNIGILGFNSHMDAYNCKFENIQPYSFYGAYAPYNGCAIASRNYLTGTFNSRDFNVGESNTSTLARSCLFRDVYGGCYTKGQINSSVKYNTYDHFRFANRFIDNNNCNITVSRNTFTDYMPYYGGGGFHGSGIYISSAAQTVKTINILTNTFNDVRLGMYINNSKGSSMQMPFNLNITGNIFNSTLSNNDINNLITNNGYIFQGMYGLRLSYAFIYSNRLTRTVSISGNPPAFVTNMRGMQFSISQNNHVESNGITSYGSDMYFTGNNNNTDLLCNEFITSEQGVNLKNASLTTQGIQGTGWQNKWDGFVTPSSTTYNRADGSITTPFDWYYKGDQNAPGSSHDFSPEPVNTNVIIPFSNQLNGSLCNQQLAENEGLFARLDAIAANTINYIIFEAESRYLDRLFAFYLLDDDADLRNSSSTWLDFYNNQLSTNLPRFKTIETMIGNDQFNDALYEIDQITPENDIETDWKYALTIAVNKLLSEDDSFTEEETNNLTTIANKPVWIAGPAAAIARHLMFLEVDDIGMESRFINNQNSCAAISSLQNMILGNLSDGTIAFNLNDFENNSYEINIYNLHGSIVFQTSLRTRSVNVSALPVGVYVLKLFKSDLIQQVQKLIICK